MAPKTETHVQHFTGLFTQYRPRDSFMTSTAKKVYLVIVEKANKILRLCLDPPDLNKAIERVDFKPPSFETISSTLNGCKVISVVDMSNRYWHQKLHYRRILISLRI